MTNVLRGNGADAPPCGLTGLAAIPAAFVLIRRTRGPGVES